MSASQHLRLSELRTISNWIGEIGELGADAGLWRTHALEGLIRMLGGQVAMTLDCQTPSPQGIPRLIDPIDIGWKDLSMRKIYYNYYEHEIVDDPGAQALFRAHQSTNFLTVVRSQLVDDDTWYASMAVSELRRSAEIDDFVSSSLCWNAGWMQGFVVYRPLGRRFEMRQRRMMRLCHLGLLRLYRSRQSKLDTVIRGLPPRARQTLDLLLAGDSIKEIAGKLNLSAYTVNDYAKLIYRKLEVTSRGKLLNRYLPAQTQKRLVLPGDLPSPPWPIPAATHA